MTACDDLDLILALGAAAGGRFEPADAAVVRQHLPGCPRCRRAAAEYTATADLLALAVEAVVPGEGLRTRILSEVYATAPAPARLGKAQRERGGGGPPGGGRLAALWRSIPSGRGFTLAGGLAAAAAVALAVWSVGPWHGSAPVTAPVSGALGQTGVRGTLTYYRDTQTAVLSVRGLAPQPGHVYEVWLVRPSNAVTPAGYLTPQPDGTWSAAIHGSMAGYSAVAATVELPGGSDRPTTQPVLSGTLPTNG